MVVAALGTGDDVTGTAFVPLVRWACDTSNIRSVGAAHTLHNALVPTWSIRLLMWPGQECTVHMTGTHEWRGERWHGSSDKRVKAQADDPARAWLLAIIEALISEADE
jgi:hypothetical protein